MTTITTTTATLPESVEAWCRAQGLGQPDACPACLGEGRLHWTLSGWRCGDCLAEAVLEAPPLRPDQGSRLPEAESVRKAPPPRTAQARAAMLAGVAVLSDEQVREIRALRGKRTVRDLAERFGVSWMTVQRIHQGLTYRHVA